MNKQNIHKFLFGVSILLVLGFVVHTIVDACKYDSMLTSFPFYAFVVLNAVMLLLPALIVFIAGLICRKKFESK